MRRGLAQAAGAVLQQPAAAQDRAGNLVTRGDDLLDVDWLAAPDAIDEAEIGGGKEAEVVGVLPVDALEALRDDQPDAGGFLRERAVLAR